MDDLREDVIKVDVIFRNILLFDTNFISQK